MSEKGVVRHSSREFGVRSQAPSSGTSFKATLSGPGVIMRFRSVGLKWSLFRKSSTPRFEWYKTSTIVENGRQKDICYD